MEDSHGFGKYSAGARKLLAVAVLALAAGQAAAQQGWEQAPSAPVVKGPPDDVYTRAMKLKQKGQYSEAMPILEAMALQGHGYEVAQLELGKCYFDLAHQATAPEAATKSRVQGFAWILSAANAGFGLAEQEMVRLYIDGPGVPTDRVEAAKWYLLWRHNPSRMQIGTSQFDAALEARLKAVVRPAEWKDAEQRADKWQRI